MVRSPPGDATMNPNELLLDALAEAIGDALYSLPEESPACDISRVILEGALLAYQNARHPAAERSQAA